jgi:hypothetical protein
MHVIFFSWREVLYMNDFESNLLEDWSACTKLLSLSCIDEFERRLEALIAAMELSQDHSWLVRSC